MPLIVSEFDAGVGPLKLIPLSQVHGRLASYKADDRLEGNMPIKAAVVAGGERVEIGLDVLAMELRLVSRLQLFRRANTR